MKCQCKEILNLKNVIYHLYGCPETEEYKEYNNLKWYKKLFTKNPFNQYKTHLKP